MPSYTMVMIEHRRTMTLLAVEGLRKEDARGWPRRPVTFALEADFRIEGPAIVGMMGPNGSGKTTLFELIAGSNLPAAGHVPCCGRNIHRVRYDERDRLAIHDHQTYQVRRFTRTVPGFMLERAGSDYPMIHLFDEPQLNTQDGYIGFMLDVFRKLRSEGRPVFVCLHPNERYHLEILREICERYMFVFEGRASGAPDFPTPLADARLRNYPGHLVEA